ncbi:MAG: hypothetical protein PHH01_02540 [Patescibacteria group bacterium]|nr:hypothetical protein [Patescibacteria group bacterium]
MPIAIDSTAFSVSDILPFSFLWQFFIDGGWIFFVFGMVLILWDYWLLTIRNKFIASTKFILLAIDVPREIEPNLKAIEHIYSHFFGVFSKPNIVEKYIKGKVQLTVSVELVSIGGYIQFIIRTPEKYRDLVESAIYAQYPETVITEVEDYTADIPLKYPNDKYEAFGSVIGFNRPNPYPIKTYIEFEHSLSQQFADPMASLLEILSKIKQGEQIWIQMVLRPTEGKKYLSQAQSIINKIIGEKKAVSKGLLSSVGGVTHGTYETITASLISPSEQVQKPQNQPKNWMMQLTPREKSVVEAIQIKTSKKSFETKFRYVYVAEKGLVNKGIGINAIFGSLNQFAAMDMNSFRPDKRTFTKGNFIFFNKLRLHSLQRKLVKNYKKRLAGTGIILNTEELASIFHFPTLTVKAPLVKRIESKRGEPPVGLPIESVGSPLKPVTSVPTQAPQAAPAPMPSVPQTQTPPPTFKSKPPSNLPFE